MIAYVDASVLLRFALGQPDALPEWRQIERGVSSALVRTESLRTLDRLRLARSEGVGPVAYRRLMARYDSASTALTALPERKPGLRLVPTSLTIAQEWDAADNARRREMLAEFEVRVVLHPMGHEPRVAVTGMEISPDGLELTG